MSISEPHQFYIATTIILDAPSNGQSGHFVFPSVYKPDLTLINSVKQTTLNSSVDGTDLILPLPEEVHLPQFWLLYDRSYQSAVSSAFQILTLSF